MTYQHMFKRRNLPFTSSSESSDDDIRNRILYSEIRRRLKGSDSSESSSCDELGFQEVHFGEIIRPKTATNKVSRQPLASISSNTLINRKSARKKAPAIYHDIYTNENKKIHKINNIDLNRGVVKLAICGSLRKITVTLLELRCFASQFQSSSAYLKVRVTPRSKCGEKEEKFQTNSLKLSSDSATIFHETATFNVPPTCESKRIFITAWIRNTHGQSSRFVGCTSFGLRKFYENNQIIQGTFYLLNESIGRKKHLLASTQNVKRNSNQSAVGLYKERTNPCNHRSQNKEQSSLKVAHSNSVRVNLRTNSAEVTSGWDNSLPAECCGLRTGDITTKVNRTPAHNIGLTQLNGVLRSDSGDLQLTVKGKSRICKSVISAPDNLSRKQTTDVDDMRMLSLSVTSTNSKENHNMHSSDKQITSCDVHQKNGHENELCDMVIANPVERVIPKSARILTKDSFGMLHATCDYGHQQQKDGAFPYNKCGRILGLSPDCNKFKAGTRSGLLCVEDMPRSLEKLSISSDSGISEEADSSLQTPNSSPQSQSPLHDDSIKISEDENMSQYAKLKPFFLAQWLRHKDQNKSFLSAIQDDVKMMSMKDKLKLFPQVLQSKKETRLFRTYLKSVYSEENLDFWLECEDYKRAGSKRQQKHATKIFFTFVAPDAPKEINITFDVRMNIEKNLKSAKEDLYEEAQLSIFRLMESDTFLRYLDAL